MFKSIRHGLFAALAGFTVLICVCYTGLALVIAYVTEDMLIDRLLQREAAALDAHFRVHGDAGKPAGDLIRVYRSAAALPPIVRERVLAGSRRAEIFTDSGQHYHLRTLDLEGGPGRAQPLRLYLLADAAPLLVVSKLIREVGGVLAAVAAGLIGLALLLAYLLSKRLVLPLQDLARQVRGIAPGREVALDACRRPDEIGYLAGRLAATFAELHAALAREHDFTRDVSHELRTPLTVMKNTFVKAGSRPLDRDELAQLRAGVEEIGTTIEVLFALARAECVADEVFDLRGCVEDSLLRLMDGGPGGVRLELELPERLEVAGSRHLAALLLNNCLGNALFHGGPASHLRLSFAHGTLCLENSVDPARTVTMQGFHHGHKLLQRIAAAMRWELAFHAGAADFRVEIAPRRPP